MSSGLQERVLLVFDMNAFGGYMGETALLRGDAWHLPMLNEACKAWSACAANSGKGLQSVMLQEQEHTCCAINSRLTHAAHILPVYDKQA